MADVLGSIFNCNNSLKVVQGDIFTLMSIPEFIYLLLIITSDPSHTLFEEYELLPSHRRFRAPQA